MAEIQRRTKKPNGTGRILAHTAGLGSAQRWRARAYEWSIQNTDHAGRTVYDVRWWEMANPQLTPNGVAWESCGVQHFAAIPMSRKMTGVIGGRAGQPMIRQHFERQLAAAAATDAEEARILREVVSTPQGAGEGLSSAHCTALRNSRVRVGGKAFAVLAGIAALVGIIVAFSAADRGSDDSTPTGPSTTCVWVEGKGPVDVGWMDAIQYCR